MPEERVVGKTRVRIEKGDLTNMDVDAFVFYAQHDLKLGSGFGTAISGRGGPSIQKELAEIGSIETCDAVMSGAGNLKAKHIIHAVGPRFQEEDIEGKLRKTMENTLRLADENGIKTLAFPPMGTGFYGIPLDLCAKVMLESIKRHLEGGSELEEISIITLDKREFTPFKARLADLD